MAKLIAATLNDLFVCLIASLNREDIHVAECGAAFPGTMAIISSRNVRTKLLSFVFFTVISVYCNQDIFLKMNTKWRIVQLFIHVNLHSLIFSFTMFSNALLSNM